MNLSEPIDNSKVINLIKSPKNSSEIEKGRSYESKLRFMTNPYFYNEAKQEIAYTDFVRQLGSLIHVDKLQRVIDHMIYPLPVTAITGEILRDLYRVFDGRNKHFSVEVESKSLDAEIKNFLSDKDIQLFIDSNGKEVLKDKPNAVVVLDYDKDKGAYPVFVDNDRIRDFKIDEHGKFVYISFLHSVAYEAGLKVEYIAFYDAYSYRVFKNVAGVVTFDREEKHALGYCPARSFLTENANSKTEFRKKTPLLPVIGSLLHWTSYDAGKRYIDNYVPFPIIEKAINACDDESCRGGFIYKDVETKIWDATNNREIVSSDVSKTACTKCAKSSLLGPGTIVNIDPTDNKEDLDARGIFKFIIPDTKSLEYIQDILDGIERKAHLKTTGLDGMITTEAVNQDQVKGSFERAKSVLFGIKKQLEALYIWVVKGLLDLQFAVKHPSISANYGTDWYILTEEHLQKLFSEAKKIGLPESEIDELYSMLVETKYKSNPSLVDRLKTINQLSPAPYDTAEETIKKKEQGVLSEDDFLIKMNLTRYIKRFELENGSISGYGSKDSNLKKVTSIYNRLKEYANEQRNNQAKQTKSSEEGTGAI